MIATELNIRINSAAFVACCLLPAEARLGTTGFAAKDSEWHKCGIFGAVEGDGTTDGVAEGDVAAGEGWRLDHRRHIT